MEYRPKINEIIINATIEALKSIKQARFFETERGYQGEFHSKLHKLLEDYKTLNGEVILETEYQKREARHKLTQRPDIILHIPTESYSDSVEENNYAVWALKHKASAKDASDDFKKLDDMFEILNYPLGFFININSNDHHLNHYEGNFHDRIHAFAIKLTSNELLIIHAFLKEKKISEEKISLSKI